MNKIRPLSHLYIRRFLLNTCLFIAFVGLKPGTILAQRDSNAVIKPVITILLPLHLDSLFSEGQYKYGNSVPKFTLPYLEFYNGVQLAAEYLRLAGISAHIQIVDTRKQGTVTASLQISYLKIPNLVIGVAQNSTDLKQMVEYANRHGVPFISASYPNDGGIKNSDKLYIVNSTLKTHCNAIYKYLLRNHPTVPLILITRKGNVESYLKTWLDEASANSASVKLNWKVVTLSDSFSTAQVKALLDSNRKNIIIGATMDLPFSQRLIKALAAQKPTYESLVVGMPNWDEIDLKKSEYKGCEVVFSTPFISSSANIDLYNDVVKLYAQKQNSKPSDMAVRGFEITYRYAKTLNSWPSPTAFAQHMSDPSFKVFCEFYFEAVTEKNAPAQVNYYENKKLYFIKKTDGVMQGIY